MVAGDRMEAEDKAKFKMAYSIARGYDYDKPAKGMKPEVPADEKVKAGK
jgi:hypothetical protein